LILILINPFNWGEGEKGLAGAGGTTVPATATRPAAAAVVAGECPTITAWKVEYWDNQELKGDPVLCRNETGANIYHNWYANSFGLRFPADNFSARFTRTIHFPEGNTWFTLAVMMARVCGLMTRC
jgi:hypothetical protein